MILHSTFINYTRFTGCALMFLAFMAWKQLVAFHEPLFDITLLAGVGFLLYARTDYPSIAAVVLIWWRFFDELIGDSGVVDHIDAIELIAVILIAYLKYSKLSTTKEK